MKGDVLGIIIILIGVIFIGGMAAYCYFTSEETKVEYPYIPSIPKYSEIIFSPISSHPGKLPSEYLDLNKDYFEFPYSIKSSFADRTSVILCPSIFYITQKGENRAIKEECQQIELSQNEEKSGYVKIKLENKEEIKNSTKILAIVNITYSSNMRGLCDLYIESGYPSCIVSKNSEIKISPLISPNPIKLDRDNSFSIDLQIEKYSEKLTLNKIEVKPLETKVIIKLKDKKIEETITISEKCELEKEIQIENPKEFLRVCTLPQPKIEVKEESNGNTAFQYFQLDCQNEATKKLKICEILQKEKKTDVLKKIPIFFNISFSALQSYSYKLYIAS